MKKNIQIKKTGFYVQDIAGRKIVFARNFALTSIQPGKCTYEFAK
jgi:hypothetical protein